MASLLPNVDAMPNGISHAQMMQYALIVKGIGDAASLPNTAIRALRQYLVDVVTLNVGLLRHLTLRIIQQKMAVTQVAGTSAGRSWAEPSAQGKIIRPMRLLEP